MPKSFKRFTALVDEMPFPSAFVFSIALTALVFTLAITIQDTSFLDVIIFWGDGLFDLLKFSAQMALILICGSALAKTAIVNRSLNIFLKFCSTQTSAVMTVTLVSLIGCYFNWGFGLVLSAIMVNKIARKVDGINFGLLVSSAYSGFLVWHGGISGSIPLKLTEQDIDLSQTIFSSFSLNILLGVILSVLCINYLFSKMSYNKKYINKIPELHDIESGDHRKLLSKFVVTSLALISFLFFYKYFEQGKSLNLNIMIFIFLIFGIFFSGSLNRYSHLFKNSVESSYGILLQFPFYAGLMSVMAKSGLALTISQYFIIYLPLRLFFLIHI